MKKLIKYLESRPYSEVKEFIPELEKLKYAIDNQSETTFTNHFTPPKNNHPWSSGKKCSVNGVEYASIRKAAIDQNIPYQKLYNLIRDSSKESCRLLESDTDN